MAKQITSYRPMVRRNLPRNKAEAPSFMIPFRWCHPLLKSSGNSNVDGASVRPAPAEWPRTFVAEIVNEEDLLEELRRRAVDDGLHCP